MKEPVALVSLGSWVLKKAGARATLAMTSRSAPLMTARRWRLKRHQTSFQLGAT